jgi:hypothetical protein
MNDAGEKLHTAEKKWSTTKMAASVRERESISVYRLYWSGEREC